jgi:uncharacterized membrane protein YtjA (UPF0391 family)
MGSVGQWGRSVVGEPIPGFRVFLATMRCRRVREMEDQMLGWALTFLVIALIAALLGFGGIAGTAVGIAKIIFFVAIVLFLISAIAGAVRGRRV